MRYLTKRGFEEEMKKIENKNRQIELRQALRAEKNKYKKPKMETSKKIMIYMFVLFNVVLFYALIAMWHFQDLSYLGVVISDIAGQAVNYGIYCLKAFNSKKSSEEMKFKKEKFEYEQGINENEENMEEEQC